MSRSDFNNDGFADLAIGVRGETVGSATDAGAANVLYGSRRGLTATGDEYWHQNSAGVLDAAESGDTFGRALASGDFDGDDFDDLAIGVHTEDIGSVRNAGQVNVLHGSLNGLTAAGDQIWNQNSSGVLGVAAAEEHFGEVLAVGDFDRDGFDDLAIGAHFEDVGGAANAGALNVLHGSSGGLTAVGDQFWHQNSRGVASGAESGDAFGTTLAVGDFDNDGFDDLAAGAPGEAVGSVAGAGAVNVLHGASGGLTATRDQLWHQNSRGVLGAAEATDGFGSALATGDFDGDNFDDLAIGAGAEDVGSVANAGSVNVLHGSSSGLTAVGDQIWDQNSSGVSGGAENSDQFGKVLAVGDFDSDGFDDLAIGASGEDVGSVQSAGAVSVLYGSSRGLTATGDQVWHQNSSGVLGVAEAFDFFGDSLNVADINDDGFEDLAIGAPGESFGSTPSAGAVHVLLGSANGLTAVGDDLWHQNSTGVLGAVGSDDLFGFSLA